MLGMVDVPLWAAVLVWAVVAPLYVLEEWRRR